MCGADLRTRSLSSNIEAVKEVQASVGLFPSINSIPAEKDAFNFLGGASVSAPAAGGLAGSGAAQTGSLDCK